MIYDTEFCIILQPFYTIFSNTLASRVTMMIFDKHANLKYKFGNCHFGAVTDLIMQSAAITGITSFMQAHPLKKISYSDMEDFGKCKKFLDFDVADAAFDL